MAIGTILEDTFRVAGIGRASQGRAAGSSQVVQIFRALVLRYIRLSRWTPFAARDRLLRSRMFHDARVLKNLHARDALVMHSAGEPLLDFVRAGELPRSGK